MKFCRILFATAALTALTACGSTQLSEDPASETTDRNRSSETEASEAVEQTLKTCILFGDSIVWLDGEKTFTGDGEIIHGYGTYLKSCGFSKIENRGEAGACIANHSASSYNTGIYGAVMNTDTCGYDLTVIAGGVNDYNYTESPMGELESGNYDVTTFYGAYQTMVEKVLSENPEGLLVLFTPLQCSGCGQTNDYGYTLADYAEAVVRIGAYYNIPVLDLYNYEGFTENDLDELTMDGVHPNNEGFKRICGNAVVPFIENLK